MNTRPLATVLASGGVTTVYHYAPLHYLPFIVRRSALLSKGLLSRAGFSDRHFRSTSKRQDIKRGFASFVHLTLDAHPPILVAKLAKGFPHFEIAIPVHDVEQREYLLCRFNIAKARYFRGALKAPEESPANGKYRDDLALPVARTEQERADLFRLNFGRNMIEVLIPHEISLGSATALRFFHSEDLAIARQVTDTLAVAYRLELDGRVKYTPSSTYKAAVRAGIARALEDETWLGDGLEFDRI